MTPWAIDYKKEELFFSKEIMEKHEALEMKLMNMLLDGDHEMFIRLRRQYESATVESRFFSGCGFATSFTVNNKSTPVYDNSFIMDGVCIDYDGQEDAFGVVLFVKEGLISMLDVYPSYVRDWPPANYDKISLYYPSKSEKGSQERSIGSVKWLVMENMSSRWWGTLFESGNDRLIWRFSGKDDVFLRKHEIFEKKLMDMLLVGDNELFVRLRKQYESAAVMRRGFNKYAFFVDFSVGGKAMTIDNRNFTLSDVSVKYDKMDLAYEFRLFIDDGLISCLVGYTTTNADEWIEDYDKIDSLYYTSRGISQERNVEYIRAKAERNLPANV